MSPEQDHFIPPHGGYEILLSYQKAVIIYIETCFFVKKWLPKYGDRTEDQLVQAARSGKQNIVEGSVAAGTSKETELKLTNVARASLEELKEDYRDFLRTRGLPQWDAEHAYTKRLKTLNRTPGANYETFRKGIQNDDPEIAANVLLGLTTVAGYLLQKQLEALEQAFLKNGGLRERMTRARLVSRKRESRAAKDGKDPSD